MDKSQEIKLLESLQKDIGAGSSSKKRKIYSALRFLSVILVVGLFGAAYNEQMSYVVSFWASVALGVGFGALSILGNIEETSPVVMRLIDREKVKERLNELHT